MKSVSGLLKSVIGFSKKFRGEQRPFRVLFGLFREVLDNHNRSIEIITDMGEKLGGDYLFDVVYIRNAYADLYSAVSASIDRFDKLTSGRYAKTRERLALIDGRVRAMLGDAGLPPGDFVVPLDDISWEISGQVGGKNANVAELKNYLKINVPEGFAITTSAFDKFMKHNGLDTRIAEIGSRPISDKTLGELREEIVRGAFPAALDDAIRRAVERIRTEIGKDFFFAVRSSAEEEDGEFSFAGQFESVLNVVARVEAVKDAYKTVIASLFSPAAVAYQQTAGYEVGKMKMAVGCMVMIDPLSSGVVYSVGPAGGDSLIINSIWGLGKKVVEGSADADFFLVKKGAAPEIVETRQGKKESMAVNLYVGGIRDVPTPAELRDKSSLTPEQVAELSRLAISIETHFRKPQDIEWALDRNGGFFILQSRPLRIEEGAGRKTRPSVPPTDSAEVLMENKGITVQGGVGGGMVFILKHPGELEHFPKGAVLVSRHDSSDFVRVMPSVSAIITDIGTPTSHMASLCREFRVPTVVNAGNATAVLTQGQKITLRAEEGAMAVYDGILQELIDSERASMKMEEVYEYRKKRYVLRYITPLNLIDPLLDEFSVEKCKSMHDILRFIHEKSVAELIEGARYGGDMLKKRAAVRLDIPIPTGIIVVDIDGGLNIGERKDKADKAGIDNITSIPFRSVIKGMMHPGVWHSEAVSLKVNDFLSSMMRMPDITADKTEYVGYNIAVISGEYVNLSLRFGYHYTLLDCYCSETTRNNHIYFRFAGGATDITKRSRRVQLLSDILKEYGFTIRTKGDLIIARLANIRQDEAEAILDQLGRLIAYTRQLDAALHDDSSVERYTRNFLEGNYDI